MSGAILGLVWGFAFVFTESFQAVFFGALFQDLSPFLFGLFVFGITSFLFIGWTAFKQPEQITAALNNPRPLITINVCVSLAVMAYFTSIKLIEPAIAYCISAGAMPITTYILYRCGVREGEGMRNKVEGFGNLLLLGSILYLGVITIAGSSGFVRGNQLYALLGVLLAITDGFFFTWVLVHSQRLDKVGVGPGAVFGLRFILYTILVGIIAYVEPATNVAGMPSVLSEPTDFSFIILIGVLLTIPPLYALQKAVALLSTLTISTLTALGPFIIFGLQLYEGRVEYAPATLIGLVIYSAGALIAAVGAIKATSHKTAINNTV